MTPYYADAQVTIYHGDCRDVMNELASVDHMITDPPYSEDVHTKQWIGAALTEDGKPRMSTAHKELGFDALTPELRRDVCREAYRLVKRWTLAFTDLESIRLWREDMRGAGLDFVRSCIWDKVNSAPDLAKDRTAQRGLPFLAAEA